MACGAVPLALVSASLTQPGKKNERQSGDGDYYEVYVGSMALRATPGPAQWGLSTAYSMRYWHLQHFMVLFKPPQQNGPCVVFDFQPKDPMNPFISLAALCGCGVPGIVQERELSTLPTKRHWLIGKARKEICISEARIFNQRWDTELKLGEHDCRHYTNALIEHVAGEHNILGFLKAITN